MSPEQARGKSLVGAPHLGIRVRAVRDAHGSTAFPGNTISDSIASVLTKEPDWTALPPATPTLLRRLLRRCLRRRGRAVARHERCAARACRRLAAVIDAAPHLPPLVAAVPRWRLVLGLLAALIVGAALTGAIVRVMTQPPSSAVTRLSIGLSGAQALVVGGLDRKSALCRMGLASCTSARMDRSCSYAGWIRSTPRRLGDWRAPRDMFISPDGAWVGFFDGVVRSRRLR